MPDPTSTSSLSAASLASSPESLYQPLILYACPTGPLAQQLGDYFERSRERFGPNKAHGYMPHCTLTGFFHDQARAIFGYLRAVEGALEALGTPPDPVVRIAALGFHSDWHGLTLESPWLIALTAQFARLSPRDTRRDALRLKSGLHLSLAYGFDPGQADGLRSLAKSLIDPSAPAGWELRLYQRQPKWVCHQRWPLLAQASPPQPSTPETLP
ncbi:MAG: hypothetical protein ACFB5Z_16585 [Elainellaceae cyanobacterium]